MKKEETMDSRCASELLASCAAERGADFHSAKITT
jgi:hypothetical protein